MYNLLVILGPTASGKTALAANLAYRLDGEVISADSRQVYRGMDIGTGKDKADYVVEGRQIPVHLTDIVDAGYQYNVYEFKRDFLAALADIRSRGKFPVLCGGSGLYIEAVLEDYQLIQVPVNEHLRNSLREKSLDELTEILKSYKSRLHNITDIVNEKRAIRAIEIEDYYKNLIEKSPGQDLREQVLFMDGQNPSEENKNFQRAANSGLKELNPLIIGIKYDVETRRKLITARLHQRLREGMTEEVQTLLSSGIRPENLIYYGLEYKFITQYLMGELTFSEMTEKLNTAIHQFAKRQMTWFRKMERQGIVIHWLEGNLPFEEKIHRTMELILEKR